MLAVSARAGLVALILPLAACGSREPEDAPALAAPTGIPVAAAGATGASYPARAIPAPGPSIIRRPVTAPTVPPDPFGPDLDDEDAGPPVPVTPPKKKGMHL